MSEEQKIVEPVVEDVKTQDGTKPENNDIPRSRLNEVIMERNQLRDSLKTFELKEEDAKKAKLQEEEKWQELNTTLEKEVESYRPFKEKWVAMDKRLRDDALSKLPESKQEKFRNLDTDDLLNVVEELSVKTNPPDTVGTINPAIPKDGWKKMDIKEKRSNWSSIVDSYKR